MDWKKWAETPWWVQRILIQGLMAEQPWVRIPGMADKVPNELKPEVFDDYVPMRRDQTELVGEEYQNDLAEWGMKVDDSGVETVTPIYMGEGSWIAKALKEQAERKGK